MLLFQTYTLQASVQTQDTVKQYHIITSHPHSAHSLWTLPLFCMIVAFISIGIYVLVINIFQQYNLSKKQEELLIEEPIVKDEVPEKSKKPMLIGGLISILTTSVMLISFLLMGDMFFLNMVIGMVELIVIPWAILLFCLVKDNEYYETIKLLWALIKTGCGYFWLPISLLLSAFGLSLCMKLLIGSFQPKLTLLKTQENSAAS